MKGIVEIHKGEKLIYRDENLIVDNAAEHFADIMTLSPSLSGALDIFTSGILNSSNYTIHAASFAKSPSAYILNAHNYNDERLVSGIVNYTPPRIYLTSINNTSSYFPSGNLPSYPDPLDQVLQKLPNSVSSLIVEYGQNLNLIPYWSSLSAVSSIGLSGAYLLGCYPRGDQLVADRDRVYLTNTAGNFIASSRYDSGIFNDPTFQAMDWRGFILKGRNNPAQGVIVSGDLVTSSLFLVQFRFGDDDLAFANLYGGITIAGLWIVNMKKTLENGNYPPWANNPLNDPREFKLFAKKTFNKNLAYIEDVGTADGIGSYNNLTVTWYLEF